MRPGWSHFTASRRSAILPARLKASAFVLALFAASALAAEVPDPLRQAVDHAVARVRPSLARIQVVSTDYQNGREIKYEGSGSGVIITKEGHLITNHHVAGHAARLLCILPNNEEIDAVLVGTDAMSDISIIQLKPATPREFPAVEFGDSDRLVVGDTVLAMGSPMSLSQSVTLGIVSNNRLVLPRPLTRFGAFTLDGEDVGAIVRWIGHDAAIYPGNSGGPLVNLQGQVVGINEINLGLSGAIPSNLARDVAQQIIQKGKVLRSWFGIQVQPLLKHGQQTQGVLISDVIDDSPAAAAGFRSGDVLMKLNGREIVVRYAEETPSFNQMIASLPIGSQVEAVVWRDGGQKTLKLTTAERPPAQPKTFELKPWGITARDLSLLTAQELKLRDPEGVLVTSVRPGGPAGESKPALQPRDVLQEVGGQRIRNLAELRELTGKLVEGKDQPTPVVVGFERKREKLLTVVKVGIDDAEDSSREASKAWLPVAVQAITRDMAEQLGANGLTGVRVTQVYAGHAAEKAGLKVGDLIVRVDNEPVAASQPGDEEVFTALIRQYRIGAKPELTVLRGKERLTIAVELARSPKLEREMKKHRDVNFEFAVREPSFFDKVREDWPDDLGGALVTEVKDGGWAALGNLATGDLILAVNGEAVAGVDALEKALKKLAQEKPKAAVFRVLRGAYTKYLELEPNWEGK